MCTSFREISILSGEVLFDHVPTVLNSFGDILTQPAFKESELEEVRNQYREMLEDRKMDTDTILMENAHSAAYRSNTLGNPVWASEETLSKFTSPVLRAYMNKWFTPSRMVVAGVGVPHEMFVEFASNAFAGLPKDQVALSDRAPAVYTGGEDLLHNPEFGIDTNNPNRPRDEPPLAHVIIAFETASWLSPDLVPMCVLQMMMGGGGSFSAGGPGKGMYSRLYGNVLNRYDFARAATAFNSIHTDSAIFGISGTTDGNSVPGFVEVMINELRKMAGPVGPLELARAKTQLKSSVFMQLESRSLLLEDIGRQLLTYGHVQTPFQIAALIDAVTPDDIIRVAKNMLSTRPTVAAIGDLTRMPTPEQITMRLLSS